MNHPSRSKDCKDCGQTNWKPTRGQNLRNPAVQVNNPFAGISMPQEDKIAAAEKLFEIVKNLPVKLAASRALADHDPEKVRSVNEILRELQKTESPDIARAFMGYALGKGIDKPNRVKLIEYFKTRTDFMSKLFYQKLSEGS